MKSKVGEEFGPAKSVKLLKYYMHSTEEVYGSSTPIRANNSVLIQTKQSSCLKKGRLNFAVITMKIKLEQNFKVYGCLNKYTIKIKANKNDICVDQRSLQEQD